MVEYSLSLDLIFNSLADPTRRDIFQRVSKREHTVNEIASRYKMSLAAVSKHLKILENARLIRKQRNGRRQIITASPETLSSVQDYLAQYEHLWSERFNALDKYLKKEGE